MSNPSVSGYQQQNLQRLIAGVKAHVKNVIQPQLVQLLVSKAQSIVSAIDNGSLIPEYTANLHDATGVAVYVDGRIQSFIPTKKAQKMTKSGFGGVNHYNIDGSEFLKRAIAEASIRFSSGIWFVVYSAVPYAYYINNSGSPLGRGQGFFKQLTSTSFNEILAGLRPISSSVTTVSTQL